MFNTIQYSAKELLCMRVETLTSKNLSAAQRRLLVKLRDTLKYSVVGGMEFQKPFDVVIRALGWVYNPTMLKLNRDLAMTGPPWRPKDHKVYPSLSAEFESTSHPHIFVAGAA